MALADVVAGSDDAAGAGVCGGPPRGVDHSDLAAVAQLVFGDELGQGVGRAAPLTHQVEPARTVGRLGEGLRRDRPDAGLSPGDHAADREVLGLHRYPELSRDRVTGDDRVGQVA